MRNALSPSPAAAPKELSLTAPPRAKASTAFRLPRGSVAGAGGDTLRATARVAGDRSTRASGTASRNRVRLAH
jgi:hypothetical protein